MVNLREKERQGTGIQSRFSRSKGRPVIYLGLLLVVLIVMFILYNPNMRTGQNNRARPGDAGVDRELTEFTREGELTFLRPDSSEITSLEIEIADDDYQRELGLMYRRQMELQQGMLFIFEGEDLRSFWMKNTYLALDILYLNSEKKIVRIHENTPPLSEAPIPSGVPARYVVEVNAGFCALYGIKTGDMMVFNR